MNQPHTAIRLRSAAIRFAAVIALSLAALSAVSYRTTAETGSESGATTTAAIDNPSGLPVPRFVALRSDEVNLRTGPGLTYPIDWVYMRKGLPVEVIDEFDTWRQIRDYEGTEGWVHQSMIDGKRTFMILGELQPIMFTQEDHGKSAARLQPGVIGDIQECQANGWCLVSVQGFRGWIRREKIWGVLDGEVFE